MDWPVPDDVSAWLVLWEAWLRDRDNDELAGVAGDVLLGILRDRGVSPGRRQRPDLAGPQPP
jgi:hypothetical protein